MSEVGEGGDETGRSPLPSPGSSPCRARVRAVMRWVFIGFGV